MNCKENPAPAPNADGLAARLNHAADDYSKMLEKPSFRPSRDMLEDCRNLLRQASAAIANPAPQTNFRVKPLTFDKGINRTAKAFGATWMVWPYSDPLKDGLGNWLWQCVDAVPHTSGRCHSEDEAINAAQADYQRRVLDLLDNPPPQTRAMGNG